MHYKEILGKLQLQLYLIKSTYSMTLGSWLKVLDVISENFGKIYRADVVSLKVQSRELKNCCQAIASTGLSRKKLRLVRYFVRVNFTRVQLISKISIIFLVCLFFVNFSWKYHWNFRFRDGSRKPSGFWTISGGIKK